MFPVLILGKVVLKQSTRGRSIRYKVHPIRLPDFVLIDARPQHGGLGKWRDSWRRLVTISRSKFRTLAKLFKSLSMQAGDEDNIDELNDETFGSGAIGLFL